MGIGGLILDPNDRNPRILSLERVNDDEKNRASQSNICHVESAQKRMPRRQVYRQLGNFLGVSKACGNSGSSKRSACAERTAGGRFVDAFHVSCISVLWVFHTKDEAETSLNHSTCFAWPGATPRRTVILWPFLIFVSTEP